MAPLRALPSVFFLGLLVAVSSFNLDTRDPVIKTMPADTEFGYSVAQHYIQDDDEHVLLVGAPKANSQYLPGVDRPGTVYRCPVTSQKDDCTELNFDNTAPNRALENKDKQFMGGAIAADVLSGDAGKVAICGHQYKKVEGSGDTRKEAPIGRCFFLENNFQGDIEDRTPFGDTGSFNPDEYGFAQAGTSVVFSPHWIPNENLGEFTFSETGYDVDIVTGNLGVYSWTGTVYSTSGSQNPLDQSKFAKKGGAGKNNLAPLGIDKGAMLGTSVACGKFRDFQSDSIDYGFDYIGGAPGYNQSIGGVAFFYKSIPEDTQNSDNMLFPAFILQGEQYKSDFGGSVLAIDLNNDGYDDLAVGARQYIGEDEKGGTVYIYINPADGQGRLDTVQPIKLKGEAKGDTFFGASLARMGDMNGDGYQDLAVGAPYQESGKGAVYIFLGSSTGIVQSAAQVIRSSKLSSPVRNLGIALSGGLDMDGNDYPDLLVGDGEGTAMLFRARPVVDLKPLSPNEQPLVMVRRQGDLNPFKIKPDQVDCPLDQNNPAEVYACVDLKVSFQYDDVQNRPFGPNEIDIRYELEADVDARNPRVFFDNKRNKRTQTMRSVAPGSVGKEKTYRLFLKKDERDLVTPVKVALKYWIEQDPPALSTSGRSLPPLNNYPSLSLASTLEDGMRMEKLMSSVEIEFYKRGCGTDQVCNCDLSMDVAFANLPQENPVLRVTQDQRTVDVRVRTSNNGEPAYSTRLLMAHSLGLIYNKVLSSDGGDVSCQPNALNQSVLECSLGNPLRRQQDVELQFSINSRFLTDTMMIEFELNTTSLNAGDMPNKVLSFTVLAESKLTLAGSSMPREVFYQEPKKLVGESAMEFEANIGPAVYHVYTLKNTGEGVTPRAEVVINWPYETPNDPSLHTRGKWLLYIMDITLTGESEGDMCYRPPILSNPLKIKEGAGVGDVLDRDRDYVNITDFGNGIRTRERRDADEPKAEESRTLKKGEKLSNLHCSGMPEDMAKCETIRCTFTNIRQDIKITIKARLWNNTLIMEYNQPGMVSIKSSGQVTIESGSSRKRRQDSNVITQEVETLAVLQKLETKTVSGIPWWIILLAVLAALLLLLLLALCLWKCGFFKRKKKETYEAEYYKATKVPKNVEYGAQPNYSVMQQGPQQGYEMQPLAGVPVHQAAVPDSAKYSVDLPPASPTRRVETTTTRYETRYEPVSPTKRSLHSVSGSGPRSAGYTQMTGSAWD